MTEKTSEQKALDLTLSQMSKESRAIYDKLLVEKQVELTKAQKQPVILSTEEREKLVNRVRQILQYGNADPKEMAVKWDERDKGVMGGTKGN